MEHGRLLSQIFGLRVATSLLPSQWNLFCGEYEMWRNVPYYYEGLARTWSGNEEFFGPSWSLDMAYLLNEFSKINCDKLSFSEKDLDESDDDDDHSTDNMTLEEMERCLEEDGQYVLSFVEVNPKDYGLLAFKAVCGYYKGTLVVVGCGTTLYKARFQACNFWRLGIDFSKPAAAELKIKALTYTHTVKPSGEMHHFCVAAALPKGVDNVKIDVMRDGVTIRSECAWHHVIVYLNSANWEKCYLGSIKVQEYLLDLVPSQLRTSSVIYRLGQLTL